MFYYIEYNGKIVLADQDKSRLQMTLAFHPEYKGCEIQETEDELVQYNGEYVPKENVPAPTQEEQSEKRAAAYQQEVDPITCHIQRLQDEEQTPEVEQEIADLKQERADKVEEIKERYPYPVEG